MRTIACGAGSVRATSPLIVPPSTESSHLRAREMRPRSRHQSRAMLVTLASPCIILVIAALSLIHCQTFGGNDDERMDCAQLPAYTGWRQK